MNEQRKRTNRVQVRLNDDEYDYFLYNLERSGLSKEAYLRKLIAGKIPKPKKVGQYEKRCTCTTFTLSVTTSIKSHAELIQ